MGNTHPSRKVRLSCRNFKSASIISYSRITYRFATAEEIGNFVALLLSDYQGGMGFLTGSDVVVDGGYTIF